MIPYLKPGDRVAIAAPARKVTADELQPAVALLESWQLKVVLLEGLFATDHQLAGCDDTRAALLQQQLDDSSIAAVLCARGGYGTVRIIDRLDFSQFLQHPKWIVGYSDITVLHSHIHRHCALPTLHATMPINIPADACRQPYPATETLHSALFGEVLEYHFAGDAMNRPGRAEAPLVGGNLSMLYSLCGSPSDLDTRGKILFIEDLDEYLYHIDRMMQNLRRCGHLAHLAGLVVGAFSDMHDNAVPFGHTAEGIILDAVRDYDYPVCFHAPAGHIGTDNCALRFGLPASLEVTASACRLTC